MYLTAKRLEDLKTEVKLAEIDAMRISTIENYPEQTAKLAKFIDTNVSPDLVNNLLKECERVSKEGGMICRSLRRIDIYLSKKGEWEMRYQSQKDGAKELVLTIIADDKLPIDNVSNVKELIYTACHNIRTKAIQGEIDTAEHFSMYIGLALDE